MTAPTRTTFATWAAAVLLHLLVAGPAFAQVQGYPVESEPQAATPDAPTGRRVVMLPPVAASVSHARPVQGEPINPVPDVGFPPPACQAPSPATPPPPCDDPFRFRTRGGSVYTGLPRTLLWDSPLAMQREPRLMVLPTTLSNGVTQDTIDTSIGATVGLLRAEPADWKTAVQSDFFAVVTSRFSQYNYQVATDYRFGFPVTFARGPWQWKVGYEHTSSHLGDEVAAMYGLVAFPYVKDEFVVGLGRYLFDSRVRVYGQAAWAVYQNVPGDPPPFRFDVGTEWIRRPATGCWGQPFVATNTRFDGVVNYDPDFTVQLGWRWRDPTRRFGEARVFGQYYNGNAPYGQFYDSRESWFGLGVAFDY